MANKSILTIFSFLLASFVMGQNKIDLSGKWSFQIDSSDLGIKEKWNNSKLNDIVELPGSMATNNKGFDISVKTPWTGSIEDSSWFYKPEYAKYRVPGNVKIPFWLQPNKYYKCSAWYQKLVVIPASWKNSFIELSLERVHWQSMVWVDGVLVGKENSLATPHIYHLSHYLTPGTHRISIRVDNRILDVNVGENSHSITDHTQTNWNGMVGALELLRKPLVNIALVKLFPDVNKKQVRVHIKVNNESGDQVKTNLVLQAYTVKGNATKPGIIKREITINGETDSFDIIYPMGKQVLLWDEFHPNLYQMDIKLVNHNKMVDQKKEIFGMRDFRSSGTQFTINGRLTFLRGTLDCAAFPKTGYPPTDTAAWMRIFRIAKSYGLNHFRFHSWCPPEAAFEAADRMGFYLQIEIDSWANQGATVGDGKPLDQYLYDESNRIVNVYGNHPSFCMLTYGNEPAGEHLKQFLTGFVNYWKQKDARRLYTSAGGWPIIPEADYNSSPDPRIQAWGQGLESIINKQNPSTDYDWRKIIAPWKHPTVSHEIGQWCVYPDFNEIKKYTGILKPKNFEIFRDKLNENKLGNLADRFLNASGKLQSLCYKADIEAALRTPGFGGFQLLGLYDFPGQGTALVGVLNAFWEDKGYMHAKQFSAFCNRVVPLARFPKMVYNNNEILDVPVEIANFGEHVLKNADAKWEIKNAIGTVLFKGKFSSNFIQIGNGIKLGDIHAKLNSIQGSEELTVSVSVNEFQNSWQIFVYPSTVADVENMYVTQTMGEKALGVLKQGGSVLLTLKKGTLKADKGGDIKIGFSSIFWNTAWTHGQPPFSLGILCDPKHPALKNFPTEYYSNYQWWDAMSHSNAILLDSVVQRLSPIVRVIDDWVTARSLGLLFECKVGKGKLLVSGIDLLTDADKRPEARQLLYSLKKYMSGNSFNPQRAIDINKIKALMN
ncbi:MAG: beta-galactosidase [Bacteroidetes bacterium]|nr:beta-galactosidase [Bacteroidota bacterium]